MREGHPLDIGPEDGPPRYWDDEPSEPTVKPSIRRTVLHPCSVCGESFIFAAVPPVGFCCVNCREAKP